MGRNNYFQFKQFEIVQEKAAMKVGIDGVLLGAWARFQNCGHILDIGTGTGLVALMAAQKTDAMIDAIEIEENAAREARYNFLNSSWAARLNVVHLALQDFYPKVRYNHILSNPPFFENSLKSINDKRSKARHADSLTLEELLYKSSQILEVDGCISLILPADKEEQLKILIADVGFFINRLAFVATNRNKEPHRILVELGSSGKTLEKEVIYLRDVATNDFSEQYKMITRDFYMKY